MLLLCIVSHGRRFGSDVTVGSAHCTTPKLFSVYYNIYKTPFLGESYFQHLGRATPVATAVSLLPDSRFTAHALNITRVTSQWGGGRDLIILEYIDKHFTRTALAPSQRNRTVTFRTFYSKNRIEFVSRSSIFRKPVFRFSGKRGRRRRRFTRVPGEARLGGTLPQQPAPAGARFPRAYAGLATCRHEPPRSTNAPEGLLQRLWKTHRRAGGQPSPIFDMKLDLLRNLCSSVWLSPGDHGVGPHLAPGALHVRALQPGTRHEELLRARWKAVLRAWLPQPVLTEMRLLQRPDSRRQCPQYLNNCVLSSQVSQLLCLMSTEMRDSAWEDVAHGAFLLRPMRATVWRGWLPWTGWQTVLSRGLFRHVRTEMWRMQQTYHGELHLSSEHTVASWLLRLQGQYFHTI